MLAGIQKDLVEALLSDDPAASAAGLGVDPDGLVLGALLVRKLRLERLLRGDPRLREAFELDPEGFAGRFRRYHRAVRPEFFFPAEEAAAFRTYEG